MPDPEGTVTNPEAVSAVPSAQPSAQTQAPAASGSGEAPPAPEVTVDPVTLRKALASLPEEELDKLVTEVEPFGKHVSKRVDRGITEYDKRRKREDQERNTRFEEAKGILGYVESLSPEQQAAVFLQKPDLPRQYTEAQEIVRGNPHIQVVADRMLKNIQRQLSGDERFKDLDWKDALNGDVADLIVYAADHYTKKRSKEMDKDIAEQVKAAVNAELAARNLSAPQPGRIPAERAGGSAGRFTTDDLKRPGFFKEHEQEILASYLGKG